MEQTKRILEKTTLRRLKACPICNGTKFRDEFTVKDYSISKENFTISKCANCGFILTNPQPAPENLGKYYESEDYVSHSQTKKGFINSIYQIVKGLNLQNKFNYIKTYVPRGTWVDYGAGAGDFVSFISKKGIDISGFEPNDKARINAETKGIELWPIEKIHDLSDDSVACITLWHVLEHIPDFHSVLELLSRKLKSGGALVIAVPNCASYDALLYKNLWAAYDVPRHLWHFKESDIKNLSQQLNLTYHSKKGMPFDSFYVSMLSEKYKKGSILLGVYYGFKSNLLAKFSSYPYSSQIYILKKP